MLRFIHCASEDQTLSKEQRSSTKSTRTLGESAQEYLAASNLKSASMVHLPYQVEGCV